MEAVAAAASIAGIITLVFQSIDGLHKFRELFLDAASASKIVNRLLDDINALIKVLEDVRDVLEQFEAQKKAKNFASLDIKLADCSKDVQVWLSTARILRPSAENGGKAWLKKFRLAVNKDAIQTIRDEIGRHRQIICLSLSVLGRYTERSISFLMVRTDYDRRNIDLDTSEKVHQIGGSVSQSLSNDDVQSAALQRIENYSRASLHSSAHSIRSMDTIRNELSRLEAMISGSTQSGDTSTKIGRSNTPTGDRPEHSTQAFFARDEAASTSMQSQRTSTDTVSNAKAGPRLCVPGESPQDLQYPEHGLSDLSATSSDIRHGSTFLYASFLASASSPASHQLPGAKRSNIDARSVHNLLQSTLLEVHPPCVVDYISLHNLLIICSNHMQLLDNSLSQRSKSKSKSLSIQPKPSAKPSTHSISLLRGQIEGLQHALDVTRQQCIHAGYSLSHIDEVLSPAGTTHHNSPVLVRSTDSDDGDWRDAIEGFTTARES